MLPHGPIVADDFLVQTKSSDPATLFRSFAQYLLHSSKADSLPVDLDRIRRKHQIHRREGTLGRRGLLFGDTIFVNSDDQAVVQRFTEAHEFMEMLATGLRSEQPGRMAQSEQQSFWKRKEYWCEYGAAELLMPADRIYPHIVAQGVNLACGRALASLCHVSLTAAIRRMLDADTEACIFVLAKAGHKTNQDVPSATGQQVLWGAPADWDPPAELRVWKHWKSPQVNTFVCRNESIARTTTAYETFAGAQPGEVIEGSDDLDLDHLKGFHPTESMLVTINQTRVLMALIHLTK